MHYMGHSTAILATGTAHPPAGWQVCVAPAPAHPCHCPPHPSPALSTPALPTPPLPLPLPLLTPAPALAPAGRPCEDTISLAVEWLNRADQSQGTALYTSSWIAPRVGGPPCWSDEVHRGPGRLPTMLV